MMHRIFVCSVALLCQSLLPCNGQWHSPHANLSVDLQSRFPSGSLTHQAAEHFAELSPSLFWASIDNLSRLSTANVSRSDRDLYESIISCDHLFSVDACSTLKFALGLNTYSPLLESNRQLLLDAVRKSGQSFNPSSCPSGVIVDYGNGIIGCGFDAKLLQADSKLEVFKFDHIYPGKTTGSPIIAYGNLDHAGFLDSHHEILDHKEKIRYILRLTSFETHMSESSFPMNGFGVELAFKNMEYNVLDDTTNQEDSSVVSGVDFSRLKERYPSSSEQLDNVAKKLKNDLQEELRIWDIANFGSQAVQYVMDSNDTLSSLAELVCDFPRRALQLKSVQVSRQVRSQVSELHTVKDIVPGENSLFLNGIAIDTSEFDIFAMHGIATKESKYIEALTTIGLNATQIDNALQQSVGSTKSKRTIVWSSSTSAKPRLDTRSDSIAWMNDIESGSKYRSWHRSLNLMKLYSGQFSLLQIRRNLYTCVAVIDPSKLSGLQIVEQLKQFVKQKAPVHAGVVFDLNRGQRSQNNDYIRIHDDVLNPGSSVRALDSVPSLIARLFHWASKKSRRRAFAFLSGLCDVLETDGVEFASVDHVKRAFLAKDGAAGDITSFDNISSDSEPDLFIQQCVSYVNDRNIPADDAVFFNGVLQHIPHPQLTQQMLIRATYTWQSKIMHSVHLGLLSDEDDIPSFIFDGTDVVASYSDLFQQPRTQWKYTSDLPVDLLYAQPQDLTYLTVSQCGPFNVTLWVYADLDTTEGASLALGAISHLQSPHGIGKRLALIPYGDSVQNGFSVNSVVANLAQNQRNLSENLARISQVLSVRLSQNDRFQMKMKSLSEDDSTIADALSKTWSSQVLNGVNGPCLIVNGRIIQVSRPMLKSDFNLVDEMVFGLGDDLENDADKYMKTVACLGARMRDIETLTTINPSGMPSIHFGSQSHFKVVAVLNPLSEKCQLLVSVLIGLRDSLHWDITLIFNPQAVISSVPIKRYYRYVFEPELRFNSDGSIYRGHVKANFYLPASTPVLTLSMETTEPWLVESSHSEIDLDNMQFYPGLGQQLVTFDLKNLLVYGTCLELSQNPSPPAGLKLLLESSSQRFDTIVMENVGYFQLKASPNVFEMKLAPGKATEMFKFPRPDQLPHSSLDLIYESDRALVPVRSFTRSHLQLFLSRRKGMEMRSLLELTEPESPPSKIAGFWNSLFRSDSAEKETIHIFSIASGHLYERFLRIMMLSVAKRMASSPYKIKFWFVGQFLSPQFKTGITSFAEQYGFSVELVTYKWPSWLRRQREKQRTIWGYKILFLDVLFPINLDRIIFIDADQIVRDDLSELWNMDLKDNPYAYPPFCDSNPSTEGFRFWKGGFWKDHLRGKPYHISALYVVDLKQFRKIRAGDTLRAIYDNLSADPNSLANLDQDLPNYAQHVIGIYSLPQEWLWCETWCSMESLSDAKTIDLCNNPMTKEPKLSRARRLLPEWDALNEEANSALKAASVPSASPIEAKPEKTEL